MMRGCFTVEDSADEDMLNRILSARGEQPYPGDI